MSTSTNRARTARIYGTIGAIAAVAFMPSFVVDTNKNDVSGIIGGIGLIIGMLGLGALAFGFRRARTTLTKVGSVGLYLLAIGPWLLASITLSEIVHVIDKDNLLQPLAGLLILVGGLTAGVSVARARVLDGWRRWALLVQAIAYVLTVAIMIAAGEHPSASVNALGLIWPLSALGTALALRTSADRFATLAPVAVS
jgi:hypothetical protein